MEHTPRQGLADVSQWAPSWSQTVRLDATPTMTTLGLGDRISDEIERGKEKETAREKEKANLKDEERIRGLEAKRREGDAKRSAEQKMTARTPRDQAKAMYVDPQHQKSSVEWSPPISQPTSSSQPPAAATPATPATPATAPVAPVPPAPAPSATAGASATTSKSAQSLIAPAPDEALSSSLDKVGGWLRETSAVQMVSK